MTVDHDAPATSGGANSRWFLNDEREFLARSLDDAEREYEAGDLSEEDYRALVTRDRARLQEVEAALTELGPDEGSADATGAHVERAPFGWRRVGIIGCCLLIVVGIVLLVVHASSPRQPGQASSGSVTQSVAQQIEEQLGEAQSLADQNHDLAALQLYDKVLTEDPRDPNALANAGWIEWKTAFGTAHSAAVVRDGRRKVEQAIRLAPTDYEGHLYYGVMLTQDENASAAQQQFAQFLADDPPSAVIRVEATVIAGVYQKLGLAVPPAVTSAAASPTSSSP